MMIYSSGEDYLKAPHKRVLLFGMSGVGKTRLSYMLRDTPRAGEGDWFHYSADYRIATRYMSEPIADNLKREAMKVPFLRNLLRSDSIYITANMSDDNLAPLSTYLGKPGDPSKGGLPFAEYMARQEQHRRAEINAMEDAVRFARRAQELYGYAHFICDCSGSICEVVDLEGDDPLLARLSEAFLLVWIESPPSHQDKLTRRFAKAPKPMYYQENRLRTWWADYLSEAGLREESCDPDAFIRWAYARALSRRESDYRRMAERFGITVHAEEVSALNAPQDFDALIARALDRRAQP